MSKITAPLLASSLILVGIAGAPSAMADANQVASGMGHELARHTCTMCHLVEPGQTNPPDHVGGPTFQSIADRPDVTVQSLRKHLRTTHTNSLIPLSMPNPALTDAEQTKIISYIISLRTKH